MKLAAGGSEDRVIEKIIQQVVIAMPEVEENKAAQQREDAGPRGSGKLAGFGLHQVGRAIALERTVARPAFDKSSRFTCLMEDIYAKTALLASRMRRRSIF